MPETIWELVQDKRDSQARTFVIMVIMSENRESRIAAGERIQIWNYPIGKYATEL